MISRSCFSSFRCLRIWSALLTAAALAGVAVPLMLVASGSLNFPWNPDDSVVCLDQFPLQGGSGSLARYFLTFKNNHPQTVQRLFTLFSYAVRGEVNFPFMNLLAFACVAAFSLWAGGREGSPGFRCAAAWLLCGFSPSIFLWVSASTVYSFPYVFLFLSTLASLDPSWRRFPLLLGLYVACVFSFGNGIALVPALAVGMVLRAAADPAFARRRLWPVGTGLTVVTALYVALVPSSTDVAGFIRSFVQAPGIAVRFFLECTGSLAKYLPGPWDPRTACVVGGVLLVSVPLWGFLRYWRERSTLPYLVLWLFGLASSAAATLGRAYTEVGTAPRYEFNSVFLCFAALGLCWRVRRTGAGVLRIALASGLVVLTGLKTLENTRYPLARREVIRELSDLVLTGLPNRAAFLADPAATSGQLRNAFRIHPEVRRAIERSIFRPPPELADSAWIFERTLSEARLQTLRRLVEPASGQEAEMQVAGLKRKLPEILEARFRRRDGSLTARVTWLPLSHDVRALASQLESEDVRLYGRTFSLLETGIDGGLLLRCGPSRSYAVLHPGADVSLIEFLGQGGGAEEEGFARRVFQVWTSEGVEDEAACGGALLSGLGVGRSAAAGAGDLSR